MKTIIGSAAVVLLCISSVDADVRDDYELTVSVVKTALKGWP